MKCPREYRWRCCCRRQARGGRTWKPKPAPEGPCRRPRYGWLRLLELALGSRKTLTQRSGSSRWGAEHIVPQTGPKAAPAHSRSGVAQQRRLRYSSLKLRLGMATKIEILPKPAIAANAGGEGRSVR